MSEPIRAGGPTGGRVVSALRSLLPWVLILALAVTMLGADYVLGKATLVAGGNGAAAGKVKAGDLPGDVARHVTGKGARRPAMAQGGGDAGPALVVALARVPDCVG